MLLFAPDEISFLRVQSMDARSYGRGSLTSSFLSSACPDLDLVAAAAAHVSSVAAAILAAVEGGILPPGKNAGLFRDVQIAVRFEVCVSSFRRAGCPALRQAGGPPLRRHLQCISTSHVPMPAR